MSKFYLWMRQDGDGCDYTIGCGQCLHDLDARDLGEALTEAETYLREECNLEGVGRIVEASVIRLEKRADLESMRKELAAVREAEAAEAGERRERAELARLQKKYGGQK